MKKLGLFATGLVLFAMVSCKDNICVKCTKVIDGSDPQELCSRDRDERQKFSTDLIKSGYNCSAEVE